MKQYIKRLLIFLAWGLILGLVVWYEDRTLSLPVLVGGGGVILVLLGMLTWKAYKQTPYYQKE